MIEVRGLTKRYGQKTAVDGLSFTIERGQVVGFLGPNGAGKSTTMNMITGYLCASAGSAHVDGIDMLENPRAAKRKIGYLPEIPPVYPDLTVEEQLRFAYRLRGLSGNMSHAVAEACAMTRIGDVRKRLIKNLSKGYRQRVGLAQALLGAPDVLILDEPTVGLDPKQIMEIRDVIRNLGKKHTIILSSHILSEISAVCSRVLVLRSGKLVADDSPEHLAEIMSGGRRLKARIAGPQAEVLQTLRGLLGVRGCESDQSPEEGAFDYTIEAEERVDIRKPLFFELAQKGFPILQLGSAELSLEEIFLQLTGDNPASKGGQSR